MDEPGSHSDRLPPEGGPRCLNCDAPAPEKFCSRCGQATRERRAPFRALVREALDQLDLDTALPRSLYNLLLRPGRLTRLYLAGKRASYVPPLRMYLVISLAFFVVFAIEPPDVSNVDIYVAGELLGPAKPPVADGEQPRMSFGLLAAPEDATWFLEGRLLEGRRERFQQMDPQDFINGLYRGIQRHVKLALFIFLPLLALVLRLLFLRSGNLYFDHLIFALHFQSFLFLGLSLARIFGSAWVYALAWLVLFPLYLLLALRRVYHQRWRWLVAKFLALVLAYFILLVLVVSGVVLAAMWSI